MKISTANYEILLSGSIVLPENEYLEFEIEGLRYRLTFKDELEGENKGQTRVTGALVSDEGNPQYLSLAVINYNALFATPYQPIEMGTLEGKKLFLFFSVIVLSGDDTGKNRVFHYTWYKSKVVNDGTGTNE